MRPLTEALLCFPCFVSLQTSWPMSKRTQSFFRKAYGDPLHHIAEDNLDDTDRMIALNEEVVALDKNLDQDLVSPG